MERQHMIRGSTPANYFTLPFEPPEGAFIRIVYAQGKDHEEEILFEIEDQNRIHVDGAEISVKLRQAETLKFDTTPVPQIDGTMPLPLKIQIGIETAGGDILWSNRVVTTVDYCLREDGAVKHG